jgi:hypothetical protein
VRSVPLSVHDDTATCSACTSCLQHCIAVEQLADMLFYTFNTKRLSAASRCWRTSSALRRAPLQATCTAYTDTGACYMPHRFTQRLTHQQDKNDVEDSNASDTTNKKSNKKVVEGSDSVAVTSIQQDIEASLGDASGAADGIKTHDSTDGKVSQHHVTVQLCKCGFHLHIAMTTGVILT